jgi:hypothetical protein
MDYLVFRFVPDREAEHLASSLSLLFLTPESKIKAEDFWESGVRAKNGFEKLNTKQLLTYTICWTARVPSITLVQFPKSFKSDAKFIDSFNDNYIGTVSKSISKQTLIDHCNLLKKLQDTDNCENWLIPNIDFFESRLKISGITDDEIDHLKDLISQSSKPIISWIENKKDKIKKNIKPYSNFIKRGY